MKRRWLYWPSTGTAAPVVRSGTSGEITVDVRGGTVRNLSDGSIIISES